MKDIETIDSAFEFFSPPAVFRHHKVHIIVREGSNIVFDTNCKPIADTYDTNVVVSVPVINIAGMLVAESDDGASP